MYPIRVLVATLISKHMLPEGRRNPHPGYNQRGGSQLARLCGYDPMQAELKYTRDLQLELLQKMGQARICVFDSMTRRKMIRKFQHSWLTGCVPAADIPDDMPPDYHHTVIHLNGSASLEETRDTLVSAYNDVERLNSMAKAGYSYVTRTYSCEHQATRALHMLAHRQKVSRGLWLPDGFQLSCGGKYPHNPKSIPLYWCTD